jgi:hypothetical protein
VQKQWAKECIRYLYESLTQLRAFSCWRTKGADEIHEGFMLRLVASQLSLFGMGLVVMQDGYSWPKTIVLIGFSGKDGCETHVNQRMNRSVNLSDRRP